MSWDSTKSWTVKSDKDKKRKKNHIHKGEGLTKFWRKNDLEWVLCFDPEILDLNWLDNIPGCRSGLSPERQGGRKYKTVKVIVLRRQALFIIWTQFHDLFL